MGTQPKTRMDTIGKGNFINYENMIVHSVQRKTGSKHALGAYNSIKLEIISSSSTFSQTPLQTAFYSDRNVLK